MWFQWGALLHQTLMVCLFQAWGCYWCGKRLLLCIADCWQQLLARSLYGAHIPPDHGFLQPLHLHERSESSEWCPCTGDTIAGRWAAGGKITAVTQNITVKHVVSLAYASLEDGGGMNQYTAVWLYNIHQAIGQYILVYASRHSRCLSASL